MLLRWKRLVRHNLLQNYNFKLETFQKLTMSIRHIRTINFLKEHGFDAVSVSEKDNIEKIVIQNPNALYKDDKDKVESLQIGEKEYTSPESIGEIYSSLVSDEYYHNNRILIDVESSINVTVTFKLDDYGNHINKWYYFRKGEIPDFVKKDIGIQ